MGVFGGDFAVGRLAPPGVSVLGTVFAITPRPETTILVKVSDSLEPARVRVKVGGALIDPEN